MSKRFSLAVALVSVLASAPLAGARADEQSTMRAIAQTSRESPAADDEEAAPVAPSPASPSDRRRGRAARVEQPSPEVKAIIVRKAQEHGVPPALADAVARVESRYNPRAAHAGNFGLMQIRLQTARGEGYAGSAQGLLDAETNAHFGIKHLARAYRMSNGDTCGAIMRYQGGLRATHMTGANRVYCTRVKAMMAAVR